MEKAKTPILKKKFLLDHCAFLPRNIDVKKLKPEHSNLRHRPRSYWHDFTVYHSPPNFQQNHTIIFYFYEKNIILLRGLMINYFF